LNFVTKPNKNQTQRSNLRTSTLHVPTAVPAVPILRNEIDDIGVQQRAAFFDEPVQIPPTPMVHDSFVVEKVPPLLQPVHQSTSTPILSTQAALLVQTTPVTVPRKPRIEINEYHHIVGHVNEQYLRATAKHYGLHLHGTLRPCIPCTMAKIHATPLPKAHVPRSTIPGERIFLDISYLLFPSIAGNKFWLLILDDATDMVWSLFLRNKSETTKRVLGFIKKMKDRKVPVRIIRLDNSGENQKLKKATLHMHITYEFTAPHTPQQNGRVERKFSILYENMQSILNFAALPDDLRNRL
jgi:hypothetical protein